MAQSSSNAQMSFLEKTGYNLVENETDKESEFDSVLKERWEEAQRKGVLRYTLNIQGTEILDGKYRFLVQLNTDRSSNRRSPQNIISMTQPFSDSSFNFTKIAPEEKLMDLNDGDEENIIIVNASPLEYCHCLLLVQRSKRLPQVITKYSLSKAIEMFSLSSSLYLRMAFNSLCANASVNHLHWHLYYLNYRMLLEYIDLEEYAGPVKVLRNFPAKGYCIKYSSVQNMEDFIAWAFLIIDYLQKVQIAHNIYITRAKSNSQEYGDLRIYIWARKPYIRMESTNDFYVASCELFGHLTVKSEEIYTNISEEYIANILKNVTEEHFLLVFDELKELIQKQLVVRSCTD